MNSQTYWFITGMRDQSTAQWDRKRCWGFFDNFAEAEAAVLANDGDIYEEEFEYVVIEEHHMGTIAMSTHNLHWYKWYDWPQSKYLSIPAPDWAGNVIHWGIG
jgi:hypothetical protein